MSIKILVDSASDISEVEAKQLGICMIPMVINFGEEEYLDGVNLSPSDFYKLLVESKVFPKTSQIGIYRFEEKYKELLENNDDELIVITISTKLSGTYNNAVIASELFENRIHVIESSTVCAGERLLVEYALSLISQGMNVNDIVDLLNKNKKRIKLMATLNTLEYLKKGGRISATVAIAGDILGIKPLVGIIDGEVKLIGKAIGSKRANNTLSKFIQESNGIDFSLPFAFIYSGNDDNQIKNYYQNNLSLFENKESLSICQLGGTIGTHIGPGGIGVAFFEK
ncbi:MAG: DegV family protein [Bacilli bacterium]